MDDKALAYMNSIKDYQQYPAARVAHGARLEGETIYMCQRSSSSTAELMNAANKSVRDRTAVDPINAMYSFSNWKQKGTITTRRRRGNGQRSLHLMDKSS